MLNERMNERTKYIKNKYLIHKRQSFGVLNPLSAPSERDFLPFSLCMSQMLPEGSDWEYKSINGDFPGGAVVKNPPANAGDTGSSPGPGRSHMPRSN